MVRGPFIKVSGSQRPVVMVGISSPVKNPFGIWQVVAGRTQGGKMKKYNYDFIIHLLLNKYGWTQEEIGAWTWRKSDARRV